MNLGKVTDQAKIVQVNNALGNDGVKNQQGATRRLFDTKLLASSTAPQVIDFFKSPNFALGELLGTNIDAQNGLLGVGEAMVIENVNFVVFTFDSITGTVTMFDTPRNSALGVTFENGFYMGTFEFRTGNSQTMKPTPNDLFLPDFNDAPGSTATLAKYKLKTKQVVPPLLQWSCRLSLPAFTLAALPTGTVAYVRCVIEGPGSLLNTKQNY